MGQTNKKDVVGSNCRRGDLDGDSHSMKTPDLYIEWGEQYSDSNSFKS